MNSIKNKWKELIIIIILLSISIGTNIYYQNQMSALNKLITSKNEEIDEEYDKIKNNKEILNTLTEELNTCNTEQLKLQNELEKNKNNNNNSSYNGYWNYSDITEKNKDAIQEQLTLYKYDENGKKFVANNVELSEINNYVKQFYSLSIKDKDINYSDINAEITTQVELEGKRMLLDIITTDGTDWEIKLDGKTILYQSYMVSFPNISINDNKLILNTYRCDVADGCPMDIIVDSNLNIEKIDKTGDYVQEE